MKRQFKTTNLKLAALVCAEISDTKAEVLNGENVSNKDISITYPQHHAPQVEALVCSFIDRKARVDVFLYNKSLNMLRDMLNKSTTKKGGRYVENS
ncbi:MAG: hypothetical protein P9M07_01585 [Candidatus Aceula meridiana]|nr:hypothetical protein [Candidatus Aceula meridiana]